MRSIGLRYAVAIVTWPMPGGDRCSALFPFRMREKSRTQGFHHATLGAFSQSRVHGQRNRFRIIPIRLRAIICGETKSRIIRMPVYRDVLGVHPDPGSAPPPEYLPMSGADFCKP